MSKNLKLAVSALTIVAVAGLSGCVVSEPAHNGYYDHGYYNHGYYYDHHYYNDHHYYDEDRDGVQNRYDGDRDGDGVPNWRDRYPDNPRYR